MSKIIVIFIIIIIVVISFFLWLRNNNSIPRFDSNNYSEIILDQPDSFYKDNLANTLKYLIAVYPTAEDTFKEMSYIDVAKFYNSLWVYYNCESSFLGNVEIRNPNDYPGSNTKTTLCWQQLPGCGTTYPKLPYVTGGYIYSFNEYIKSWTPWIISTSIEYAPKDISASIPGQTYWNWDSGPGPVWMYQRAIFRMIYNTELPKHSPVDGYVYPSIMPGPISSLKPEWKYPSQWWLGVPDYGYMEIMAASEPGLPTSPPICWFDGWVGSGMFINVGKSLRVRNKIDGVWRMVQLMSMTQSGADTVTKWYGSSDPYQVCKNLVMTNNNSDCVNVTGPMIISTDGITRVQHNLCTSGYFNNISVPDNNIGGGWYAKNNVWIPDIDKWCDDTPKGINYPSDECIDNARFGYSYKAERQASIMTFDEPLFAMGCWLGFDTVQMTNSANGMGYWQFEMLELRNYPPEVKNRDYTSFMMLINNGNNDNVSSPYAITSASSPYAQTTVSYISSFVTQYMAKVAKNITLRDPLNVYDDSKASACVNLPWSDKLASYNLTCKGNISDMFTNLSIVGGIGTNDNQCSPNGTGAGGQKMLTPDVPPFG